ncbi:MAG: putative transcriptional regulator ycf27 [Ilumatobacteraceae bacterium]|nr:putative transcriptional regulator ycf27 [Ilumatobacteraceae bacterium]
MGARVAVAEDDPKQSELIRRYLEHEGHTVVVVADGRAAIDEIRRNPPDILILDIMLPKIDGLDVCRVLRSESTLPILMLTARTTQDDLLLGLDLGADDYMTKPFSPPELMARVRTLLRRGGAVRSADPRQSRTEVGRLAIDRARHEVTFGSADVVCTAAEFRLLDALVTHVGHVLTRDQLLELMHGIDPYITQRAIDFHIRNLRRKIEPDPSTPSYLLTVYGVGYKLADHR